MNNYLSYETKNAVVTIDKMFMNLVNIISYQDGDETSLPECMGILETCKPNLPVHVYSVLRHLLLKYTREYIDGNANAYRADFLIHNIVYQEFEQYEVIASYRVRAKYEGVVADNMVFEEIYEQIYERYFAEILKQC